MAVTVFFARFVAAAATGSCRTRSLKPVPYRTAVLARVVCSTVQCSVLNAVLYHVLYVPVCAFVVCAEDAGSKTKRANVPRSVTVLYCAIRHNVAISFVSVIYC